MLRTLLRHPSFSHGDPRRIESNAVQRLFEQVNADAPPPFELTAFLATEELPSDVRRTIRRMHLRRRLVRRFVGRRRSLSSPRLWKLAGEHRIVRSYFDAARRIRGSRVVEKTPAHLHSVQLLRIAYSDARFVCVLRHPVDVLSSHWRRYERQGDLAPWANVSVDDLADLWARDIQRVDRLATEMPGAVLVVRYEDLVADPGATMRAVCEHIGEPFDPACLNGFEETATLQKDDERPSGAVSRWRDNVSEDDAARLQHRLAELMARHGYATYGTKDGLVRD